MVFIVKIFVVVKLKIVMGIILRIHLRLSYYNWFWKFKKNSLLIKTQINVFYNQFGIHNMQKWIMIHYILLYF